MRKLLVLLLALAMLLGVASAQENPEELLPPLNEGELNVFTQMLVQHAISQGAKVQVTEEGNAVEGQGYRLILSGEDLSEDSLLLEATLDDEAVGVSGLVAPRTLIPTQSAGAVLASFPNDNPELAGDMHAAVLYIRGQLPQNVYTGKVVRDGQTLTLIEYCAYVQSGDQVDRSGLQFVISQGLVDAVVYFGGDTLSLAQAEQELSALSQLQEAKDYVSYRMVEAAPLTREDLSFAGLDFLDASYEQAVALFNDPVATQENQDGSEKYFIAQWDGLELTFHDTSESRMLIYLGLSGMGEGPRGVRMGSTLSSLLETLTDVVPDLNQTESVLYGNPEDMSAPFAILIHSAQGQDVVCYVPLPEGGALVTFTLMNDLVVSIDCDRVQLD
jgi:hypothetical protein